MCRLTSRTPNRLPSFMHVQINFIDDGFSIICHAYADWIQGYQIVCYYSCMCRLTLRTMDLLSFVMHIQIDFKTMDVLSSVMHMQIGLRDIKSPVIIHACAEWLQGQWISYNLPCICRLVSGTSYCLPSFITSRSLNCTSSFMHVQNDFKDNWSSVIFHACSNKLSFVWEIRYLSLCCLRPDNLREWL